LEEYALEDDIDIDLFGDSTDGTRTLTMSEVWSLIGGGLACLELCGIEGNDTLEKAVLDESLTRSPLLCQVEDEATDASSTSGSQRGGSASTQSGSSASTKKRKADAPRRKSEEQMERRR
jgi:hypothetical protein